MGKIIPFSKKENIKLSKTYNEDIIDKIKGFLEDYWAPCCGVGIFVAGIGYFIYTGIQEIDKLKEYNNVFFATLENNQKCILEPVDDERNSDAYYYKDILGKTGDEFYFDDDIQNKGSIFTNFTPDQLEEIKSLTTPEILNSLKKEEIQKMKEDLEEAVDMHENSSLADEINTNAENGKILVLR